MGTYFKMTDVLIGRRVCEDKDTGRKNPMQTKDWSDASIQGNTGVTRIREGSTEQMLPNSPQKVQTLLNPGFGASSLQKVR